MIKNNKYIFYYKIFLAIINYDNNYYYLIPYILDLFKSINIDQYLRVHKN